MAHAQRVQLVQCTFARPDAWLNWKATHDADRPLQGLQEIALLGLGGYVKLWRSLRDLAADLRHPPAAQSPSANPTNP